MANIVNNGVTPVVLVANGANTLHLESRYVVEVNPTRRLAPLLALRARELAVPVLQRVYCAGCGAWIADGREQCASCGAATCVRCGKAAHAGRGCAVEVSEDVVFGAAEREGWQQCPGCLNVVERSEGCPHMT